MSASVEKLKSLKAGQLLLIETTAGELLVGTLKSISSKYLSVELDNVRDIKTNYTYQSAQVLAYTHMKSIKLMFNENEAKMESKNLKAKTNSNLIMQNLKDSESSTTNVSPTSEESSNRNQENIDNSNIHLTVLDLQLLQKQLDNIIFITQTDHKYHKALNDIKSHSVVGLVIDPIEMGRNCKTSLMAISTPQFIYIFDMLALGKMFKEVRSILQAERPRKAVHFSHKLADHLKHRHNVLLQGIFDTFLAYCVVTNEKTCLTLEETIQMTFSLSDVYFGAVLTSELPVNSYQRPVPLEQRIIIGKKVAFQLKLYDHLLHEYMLKNFYAQCDIFSQTFGNNNDNFQVGQQLHRHSRAGYEHIQPNGNWKEKLNIKFNFLKNHDNNLQNNTNLDDVSE